MHRLDLISRAEPLLKAARNYEEAERSYQAEQCLVALFHLLANQPALEAGGALENPNRKEVNL